MDVDGFTTELKDYQFRVVEGNTESYKASAFLDFVRRVFDGVRGSYPHKLYPQLEKSIKSNKTLLLKEQTGRIDAFSGNLIIEFEVNLIGAKREEAEDQLKEYVAILWNMHKTTVRYICIATDGLDFFVFRPRSKITENFTKNDIELQLVNKFDIRKEVARNVYESLDRYLFDKTLIPPTSEDIVSHFGSKSAILSECMNILEDAWQDAKDKSIAMYDEWIKYLSYVYGSEVSSSEGNKLFLKQTYLATLAKLMVYSYYQENIFYITHCRVM